MLAGTGVQHALDDSIPSSQANILWQHMTALHGGHPIIAIMTSPLPPSLSSLLSLYLSSSLSLSPDTLNCNHNQHWGGGLNGNGGGGGVGGVQRDDEG